MGSEAGEKFFKNYRRDLCLEQPAKDCAHRYIALYQLYTIIPALYNFFIESQQQKAQLSLPQYFSEVLRL